MKITESLARFTGKNTLIIVAGEKEAKLYFISGDTLSELGHPTGPEIKYSDRESFYNSSSKGISLGSGSIKDNVEEKERREFRVILRDALADISSQHVIEKILLAAPRYIVDEYRNIIKDRFQVAPLEVFGNFIHESPFEVLERF